jgi:antitoxin component of RelBE/YafQ-DinJ toxin-antitoxin module
MSAIAKSRIDPDLKRKAEAVLNEIRLKPRAALELLFQDWLNGLILNSFSNK